MARKTVYSAADVVAAAVEVVQAEGLEKLSARHVAGRLGSSTAPVYSNFATMDALARAVKRAVADDMLAFASRRYTDNLFLNIGIGVLEFVRRKPALFAAVFTGGRTGCEAGTRVMAQLGKRMAAVPELAELPAGERLLLLTQMSIFTHGLAVQISGGLVDDFAFDSLLILLADAGEGMTRHALSRPPRSPEQLKLIASLLELNAEENSEQA